jgi:hypothetical protein
MPRRLLPRRGVLPARGNLRRQLLYETRYDSGERSP